MNISEGPQFYSPLPGEHQDSKFDSLDSGPQPELDLRMKMRSVSKNRFSNQYTQYFNYLKRYELKIEKHTVVDEKDPFVLYAVEIQSEFSKFIMLKQFQNFVKLQQELVKLKDSVVQVPRNDRVGSEYTILDKLLPKLPAGFFDLIWPSVPSADQVQRQKENLKQYSQALLDLLIKCTNTQYWIREDEELEEANYTAADYKLELESANAHYQSRIFSQEMGREIVNREWIDVILKFFQLEEMAHREDLMAKKIKNFFSNIKKMNLKKKFLKLIYQSRGYTSNFKSLPSNVVTYMFEFLTPLDRLKSSQICNQVRRYAIDPYLWRDISIISKQQIHVKRLGDLLHRSSHLKVLSLKFCPYVCMDTLQVIAEECNPFFLRELYLDGCDKINDQALQALVGKTSKRAQFGGGEKENSLLNGDFSLHDFSSIAATQSEMNMIVSEICAGGALGLQVISLSECRNIFDAGISYLGNMKFLSKVILLGCANIKDEGIKELAQRLKYLEHIDIGGTMITAESLRELVTFCLNLKKVNISGCKKLNASDDNILKANKINFEGGEDVFRFYLIPEQFSDLPRITNSVLKTRSTLSLHKVYKYLFKKLQQDHVLEDISEDIAADSQVEILCNNVILNPYVQLKEAKEKYWPYTDLMTLHYRRKELVQEAGLQQAHAEFFPKKPPLWVPDHLALQCMKCEAEFSLFRRIHHCRNCGKCFCNDCCNQWRPIEHYGYQQPVRVCTECKVELARLILH